MKLYGICSMRTNNTAIDMEEKFKGCWHAAFSNLGTKKTTLYGVYHDLGGSYKEDYSFSIATEDIQTEVCLEIPEQTYQIFEVDNTKENGVFYVWQQIWSLEEEGKLQRSYLLDYEKYTQDGQIRIYIGVKNK